MSRLVYDIESDGLLDEITKIHCIVTRDVDSGVIKAYYDVPLDCPEYPPAGSVADGVAALETAELRIGHYIQGFDEAACNRFYGLPRCFDAARVLDTKVAAAVIWPDEHLKATDYTQIAIGKIVLPKQLIGRHSLEAWGHRLKVQKDDFGKQTDWKALSPEMLRYCVQDTRVTLELYRLLCKYIAAGKVSLRALSIENEFAWRMQEQQLNGICFDVAAGQALSEKLLARRAELTDELTKVVPPFVDEVHWVTLVRKEKKHKTVTTLFNPGSDHHIARYLIERLGWKPEEFTPTGRPKVGDSIIESLPFEGIDGLREYAKVAKILGMLSEGAQSWLKLVKPDGRIHGRVNHNGAVTGRCTHSAPNVTQVPRVRKGKEGWKGGFGLECRRLFRARPGWVMVGCDASGLELRMLAHYMAKYDGGEYAKVVCEGDVHTRNMEAAGLTDRDQAKTFIYALNYGAGNGKLGKVLKRSAVEAKKVRERFLKAMPALRKLMLGVKATARQKKALRIADGRLLHTRSEHAALNTLLQGTGALVMKVACNTAHQILHAQGIKTYAQVHQAHDELQFECPPEYATAVGEALKASIESAGKELGICCPLTGEWRVGESWAGTH